MNLRLKLAISYIFIILLTFLLMAYLLYTNLGEDAFREIKSSVLVSLFFALGLALMLGSVLIESITRPTQKIMRGARKFSRGDFQHKIVLDSKDEIGELALTLNNMAQAIEDKIREVEIQNQHLGAILQSMVEGIIVIDKSGCIISMNKSSEKIFNIRKEDVKEKLFLEAIPNSDISDLINVALEKSRFISKELTLLWPVQKIFRIDTTPIFEKDTINGCLVVIHDITEMRKLEMMRKDFVANVSHELKTPLTSIKGFIETLLEGAIDDKANASHFLKIIEDHATRLDDLVNDLLSLSYLESKEISIKKEKIDIRTLADDILAGFKSRLNKGAIRTKNELPINMPVTADKNKLSQVLTNLIDNAIKFNEDNGEISIYGEKSNDGIKIIVEDTGIGIPGKDLARIFERFYRVDKTRSREMGGTGLGLSIVKHIIELHGGTVEVESTDGVGSKFFFTLPY